MECLDAIVDSKWQLRHRKVGGHGVGIYNFENYNFENASMA